MNLVNIDKTDTIDLITIMLIHKARIEIIRGIAPPIVHMVKIEDSNLEDLLNLYKRIPQKSYKKTFSTNIK